MQPGSLPGRLPGMNTTRIRLLGAVTVLAALPTAQNIFLYAQRFEAGVIVARDAIFLSTIACVPVLLLIALLFTH